MNQKGMTLIEVLLAMVLSSLFFCALMPGVLQGYRAVSIADHEYHSDLEVFGAISFIQDEIRNAQAVQIWVGEDPVLLHATREIGHVQPLTIEGEIAHVKRIVLDEFPSGLGAKQLLISHESDGSSGFKLAYQGRELIAKIKGFEATLEHGQLIFTLSKRLHDDTLKAYSFAVDLDYKGYQL